MTDKVKYPNLIQSKYTKQVAKFICDKIEDGMTLRNVCKTYTDVVPSEKTIYNWLKQHPEFKELHSNAIRTWFFKLIDETKELADAPIPEGLTSQEVNQMLKQRDQQIKTNQFLLQKIAPFFVNELEKRQEAAVNLSLPTIKIISYRDIDVSKT